MKMTEDIPPEGTIRDWLDMRAEAGGVAVVFPEAGTELSWHELREGAIGFARALTSRGVARGESVAVMAPNSQEALCAFYGAVYGGFRAVMINLAAGRDAIAYALEHSEARFAYVHPDCAAIFDVAAAGPGLEALPLEATGDADLHAVSPEDHALLMYPSGTQGRPKGVVHSHASLLAGGWTTAVAHRLARDDRGFCVLPVYHINTLPYHTVYSDKVGNAPIGIWSTSSPIDMVYLKD